MQVTIDYLDPGPGRPPVILMPKEDFQLYIDSRLGEVAIANSTIARCEMDIQIAEASDDEGRDQVIQKYRAELDDARQQVKGLEDDIASQRRVMDRIDEIRRSAEAKNIDLRIPTWEEAIAAEHRFRKLKDDDSGWLTDREAVVAYLMRSHCPAALKEHPVIGRYVMDTLSRHLWPGNQNLSFLLASLSRS